MCLSVNNDDGGLPASARAAFPPASPFRAAAALPPGACVANIDT